MVPIFSKMWSVTLLNGSDVMTSAGSSGAGTRQRLACMGVRRVRGERIRGSLFFSGFIAGPAPCVPSRLTTTGAGVETAARMTIEREL